MNERLLNPISHAELDRRWAAVREAMAERRVEALVVQSNNDWLGGYAKWLTDHPATNGYPKSVIFYADDFMTVVDMGPRGGRRKLGGNDEVHRGVGEILTTPAFTTVAYTDEYQAELVAGELKRRGCRAVGDRRRRRDAAQVRHPPRARPRRHLRRHDRGARPPQGDQEPGGDRRDPQGGGDAGRDLRPRCSTR